MGMSIDEAITRYKNNAEYERTHGNLQGCLGFRQLADWLEKLQKIVEIADEWKRDHDNLNYADDSYYWNKVREVMKDGNDDLQ